MQNLGSENHSGRRRRVKKITTDKNGPQIRGQTFDELEVPVKLKNCKEANNVSESSSLLKALGNQRYTDNMKEKKKTAINGDLQSVPQTKIYTVIAETAAKQNKDKKMKKMSKWIKNVAFFSTEFLSMDETKTNEESTEKLAMENANFKREGMKESGKKDTDNNDEDRSMDLVRKLSNLDLSDESCVREIDGNCTEQYFNLESEPRVKNQCVPSRCDININDPPACFSKFPVDNPNTLHLCKHKKSVLLQNVSEVSSDGISSESVLETPIPLMRPLGLETEFVLSESQLIPNPNQKTGDSHKPENRLDEVSGEIIVYQGRSKAEDRPTHLCSSDVREAECKIGDLGYYSRMRGVFPIRKKLLVLDLNGLLADIVMHALKDCKGDVRILGREIFRRPFYDDFLKFCFDKFDVAIWSSRSKKIIDKVVDYLLGELKDHLLFCWDMAHCTRTGFRTLENRHKPLVCKELRKIWENKDPKLPWRKGDYDESNTLLLDDSPYKALLNPLHTAIFPVSYHYEDKADNSLGIGGDLRVYLEGLLISDDVRTYTEQHPFGQEAIDERNPYWQFYSQCTAFLGNLSVNNDQSDSRSRKLQQIRP